MVMAPFLGISCHDEIKCSKCCFLPTFIEVSDHLPFHWPHLFTSPCVAHQEGVLYFCGIKYSVELLDRKGGIDGKGV